MTRQRLQKLIAAAGLCSRRKAEVWLQQGRVTV
ncbi:MAG: S4 domain-containing protein, partial [Cyanobacteriota bacterium]|nr:S4 domain-containing protein [Cyanobacteriota bacterium]MED5383465.1 S4 domain-containing protein [Cyanobacteriota bacterium]